jgi:pimeloyl-ACP methyl ester carboxylesterase
MGSGFRGNDQIFGDCVMQNLPDLPLPAGVRPRFVEGVNGLTMHVLEAGFESKDRPCVLLLHGFPELAFSWRKVMPALAQAGYHVIAPDQRGYGRTTPAGMQAMMRALRHSA